MGVALTQGLYFEFKLKGDVNWEKFAHDKHLNQLHTHKKVVGPCPSKAPHIQAPHRLDWIGIRSASIVDAIEKVMSPLKPATERWGCSSLKVTKEASN